VLLATVVQLAAAQGVNLCACDLTNNIWLHRMSDMIDHVHDLPTELQNDGSPAVKWIQAQSCIEDASKFPNSELAIDIEGLARRGAAGSDAPGEQAVAAPALCVPGQVGMALVCVQKHLVGRSLVGALKWVQKMADLLSLVADCMDTKSPLPFLRAEFEQYLSLFQTAVPRPEDPRFLNELAFPHAAKVKPARLEAVPAEGQCLPLKERACFPSGTANALESCMQCCDPSQGPAGNTQCWDATFAFSKCCQGPGAGAASAATTTTTTTASTAAPPPPPPPPEVKPDAEAEKLVSKLREDLAKCGEDREALKKASAEEKEALKKASAASSAALASAQKQLTELQTSSQAQQGQIKTLQGELQASQAEVAKLKKSQQELQQQKESQQSQQSAAQGDLKALQDKLAAAQKEVTDLKKAMEVSKKEAQTAQQKADEEKKASNNKLTTAQAEVAELKKVQEQLKKEAALKLEEEKKKASGGAQGNEAAALKKEIATLTEKLEASKVEVSQLKKGCLAEILPTGKPAKCEDQIEFCKTWAANGESCKTSMMLTKCPKSCGAC